jgi:Anti-sigma-K factor rskA
MHQQVEDNAAAGQGGPIDAEAAQLQRAQAPEAAPHGRDSAARWRALAGMAMSLALACLIVTLEFTGQAAHRADRMNRHAEGLLSKVSRLEAKVVAERARISVARRELAAAETLRALLRAPDAAMLRLSPPAAAGGHKAAPAAHRPEAVLALSPREHRAVLMVAGLKPPANDALFVLWLSPSHGAPLRAAEFRTAADGSALVTGALPPALEVTEAMVTVERVAKGDAADGSANRSEGLAQTAPPSGPVQLRGTLAR